MDQFNKPYTELTTAYEELGAALEAIKNASQNDVNHFSEMAKNNEVLEEKVSAAETKIEELAQKNDELESKVTALEEELEMIKSNDPNECMVQMAQNIVEIKELFKNVTYDHGKDKDGEYSTTQCPTVKVPPKGVWVPRIGGGDALTFKY